MKVSYSDVFGVQHHQAEEPVHAGDVVAAGANNYPRFRVIAVEGDRAWVRNEHTGRDDVVQVSRLRRLEPA